MHEPEEKRAEGQWEEVKGRVKGGVGDLLGNRQMEAEGDLQATKGEVEQDAAKAEAQAKGAWQETKGRVKGAVGDLVGDKTLEAEGDLDQIKGQTRQDVNR